MVLLEQEPGSLVKLVETQKILIDTFYNILINNYDLIWLEEAMMSIFFKKDIH